MSGNKRLRSVTEDPRWRDMVIRYRYDWATAVVELFGIIPSWQQEKILDSVQEYRSRTTVTSGHGTGKSSLTGMMLLVYMIMFPDARVVIVANKIGQVKTGVFKYVKTYWAQLVKRHPWLQNHFVLTETMFYEKSRKGIWQVICKGFRPGNEESLAGEHADNLLLILDEASGISDKAISIMMGALTQGDNRMLMMSQPTRPSGYFYDSHHKFSLAPGNKFGLWYALVLNSEESPFVTMEFIREKLVEYGGRDSLEYMVKVLGVFPRNINGYLLGRDEMDRAARRKVYLEKGWGWVATADVGNGRDKSILNICKVSGHGETRRVVSFKVLEMPGNMDPITFGDFIANECTQERYPGITIGVDGDGVGSGTVQQLRRRGVSVTNIRWGLPPFSKKMKERFRTQRDWANVMAADAIRSGRLRTDASQMTAEQGSKIPYYMDEMGRIKMVPKPQMRTKLNIKSPDRWDTYCFMFLMSYRAAEVELSDEMEDFAQSRLDELAGLDDMLK